MVDGLQAQLASINLRLSNFTPTEAEPACFNSLPLEIRQEIWALTLTPRLIYLHPHQRLAPPHWDPEKDQTYDRYRYTSSVRFNHSIHSPKETPATAFREYAEFATTEYRDRVDIGRLGPSYKVTMGETAVHKGTKPFEWRKEPKGGRAPPALYLCRESRELALKRGYVLAFKGWLERRVDDDFYYEWHKEVRREERAFWARNKLDEKGIWINFEADMVMLDFMWRAGMYPKCSNRSFLKLMKIYVPGDLARIQRLAIGGTHEDLMGTAVSDGSAYGLESLREIWYDDEFGAEDVGHEEFYKDKFRANSRTGRARPPRKFSNAEAALEKLKEKTAIDVRLVRGSEWHSFFL